MKKQPTIQAFDIPIPSTEEMERRVLADALVSPELLGDTIPVLHPEFFTTPTLRALWEAVVARHNAGEEVGFSMSAEYPALLTEVIPYTKDAGMAETPVHAQQLRNAAARQRTYIAAVRMLQDATDPTMTEAELLSSVEGFARTVEGPSPLLGDKHVSKVIDSVEEEAHLTEQSVKEGKAFRVTTGFEFMDKFLWGGMKPGQLVILAARPSVGKTALMLQMAKSAAVAGNPVQVFSLEMTAEELGERLLFGTGLLHPYALNNGQVDWQVFEHAKGILTPLPLYVNDFSRSLDDIVTRLTQAVKKGKCRVAYIDYLGLMQEALNFGGGAKLYQVIARITGTLKCVAKRLRIPIVLLCQLNRDSAKDKDRFGVPRAPQLFDLRDSGSIEQDADIVLMMDNKMATQRCVHVWIRKNRAGKKDVCLVYKPNNNYSAFTEDLPILPDPPEPVELKEPYQPTVAVTDAPVYKDPEDDDDKLDF